MNAQEAVCRDATIQKQSQFALDKPGNRMVPFRLPGQKGLQILSNHLIKDAFFGIAGTVGGRRITNE